jgi:hypothetical protein
MEPTSVSTELAQSIKSNGVIQPIVVRRASARNIPGSSPTRTALARGAKGRAAAMSVPYGQGGSLRQGGGGGGGGGQGQGERSVLEMALIENIQAAENLNPIDEARLA